MLAWGVITAHFSGDAVESDDSSYPEFERRDLLQMIYDQLREEGCYPDSEIPWYRFDWTY